MILGKDHKCSPVSLVSIPYTKGSAPSLSMEKFDLTNYQNAFEHIELKVFTSCFKCLILHGDPNLILE